LETINYIKGDATAPVASGKKIIVHICNDIGGWGKGFVLAISKKWKEPEQKYRDWFKSQEKFELGEVQFVGVELDLSIANMIGQHKIKTSNGQIPIRYEAVKKCLSIVGDYAISNGSSIHMPRIGCGLAGGDWDKIESIIKDQLIDRNIEVTVYDFE
jgi:O-acetyl-ADP-ribose deacetylase (regulator of RNase III)